MLKQQQVFLEENMSNLTSAASGEASVSSGNTNRGEPSNSIYLQQQQQQQQYFPQQSSEDQQPPAKKKRNLPGNPDPDAEVIALSPKSLLATNRFVCEICNKGFQRDQNLQLHRRGHNLPWKLKQRTNKDEVKKKVYVCPEPSCVHHDPSRALGDLTGIKKHFCRKHGEKKHKCEKCSKRYAVQSDWKAHSKVCGTREYRCDCGTLFSRRDSFITHRAFCDALAEETARAITTTNPLLSNPIVAAAGPSASHFINLQQQQIQHQLMSSNNNNNNNQQHQVADPLHAFPLKREQNMINLPPWLACPPMDQSTHHHHHHQNQLQSPTSSSSIIFPHNNQDHQMMHHQQQQQQQQNHQHHQQQQQIPNPSNPSMGPTFGVGVGGLGGPYHTQAASAHMSATALLQKAAQMGATMSNTATPQPHLQQHHHQQQQSHVPDTNSNATPPTTSTAGLFGLNLSSRDHQDIMPTSTTTNPTSHPHNTSGLIVNQNQGLSSFGNKAATPTTNTNGSGSGSEHPLTGPSPSPNSTQGPPPSSYFHDMMVNSLSSTYDHHDDDAFGIPGMTMLGNSNSKKDPSLGGFHQPRNDGNGGANDGLTRDFLGLRPLSHSDILTIAGFGNCMTPNNPSSHQQDGHKSWQG